MGLCKYSFNKRFRNTYPDRRQVTLKTNVTLKARSLVDLVYNGHINTFLGLFPGPEALPKRKVYPVQLTLKFQLFSL